MRLDKCNLCYFCVEAADEKEKKCLVCTNFPGDECYKIRDLLDIGIEKLPIVTAKTSCKNWMIGKREKCIV